MPCVAHLFMYTHIAHTLYMDMKNTCVSDANVRERDFVRVQIDSALNERWNQRIVQKRRLE